MKRRRETGFSVIEALLAVAMIAVALIPLMGLQIRVNRDYSRQREIHAEIEARRNALAVLRDVNMMREPAGALRLAGDRTLRWRAIPRSGVVRSTDGGAGDGAFEVALYTVVVTVLGEDGRIVCTFQFLHLGWRSLTANTERGNISPARS